MRRFKNINSEVYLPSFKKDKLELAFILFWFLALVIPTIYAAINFGRLPNQIPLFYSHIWGEGQLAPKIFIYLPILGIFVFGIINIGLTFVFKNEDKIFKYFLLSACAILAILAVITVFNIIWLLI